MTLVYRMTKQGDTDTVYLSGHINEDAEAQLIELLDKVGPKCVLNLKDIAGVNSLGVRAWIHFIRNFENNRTVIFEECTPELVYQMNMIPNFKGNSTIRSLYARYICENCSHQQLQLFKFEKNMPKTSQEISIPEITCPQCSNRMEMEEFEDEFFSCLIDAA